MFLNAPYGPPPPSGAIQLWPLIMALWFFQTNCTPEDAPLLRVARKQFNPDVEARMREQEAQAQQQAALQAEQASAVKRPVGSLGMRGRIMLKGYK